MANSLFFSPLCSLNSTNKPGIVTGGSPAAGKVIRVQQAFQNSETTKIQSLKAANSSNQSTKVNSIVCSDCDGNGSLLCSQCQGSGVNSVDHFNGQFKAGGLCWLCRGKKEILCGAVTELVFSRIHEHIRRVDICKDWVPCPILCACCVMSKIPSPESSSVLRNS